MFPFLISHWGHDFRPDYLKLGQLKQNYADVPIVALTATATQRVEADIVQQLGLNENCKYFLSSFNRPNLQYMVEPKTGNITAIQTITKLIQETFSNVSGIVYCITRKDCEKMSKSLIDVSKLIRTNK